jgi:hypothetical protein
LIPTQEVNKEAVRVGGGVKVFTSIIETAVKSCKILKSIIGTEIIISREFNPSYSLSRSIDLLILEFEVSNSLIP